MRVHQKAHDEPVGVPASAADVQTSSKASAGQGPLDGCFIVWLGGVAGPSRPGPNRCLTSPRAPGRRRASVASGPAAHQAPQRRGSRASWRRASWLERERKKKKARLHVLTDRDITKGGGGPPPTARHTNASRAGADAVARTRSEQFISTLDNTASIVSSAPRGARSQPRPNPSPPPLVVYRFHRREM